MSILIKSMKMPVERQSFTITIQYNGLVLDSETGIPIGEAYELPPHGRLIDADALVEIEFHGMQADKKISYQMGWNDAVATIAENAPTILEAEGETE